MPMGWKKSVVKNALQSSILMLLASCNAQQVTKNEEVSSAPAEKPAAAARFDPSKIALAQAELRKEPKVVDLIFDEHNPVEWHIAVVDDGSNRSGYAGYICLKLREFGVYDENVQVRIVDASKRGQYQDAFRNYSLGAIQCVDEQFFD